MRRSLTFSAVTAIAFCGLPAAVSAQTPPVPPTPPPSVVPPAQPGKVSIRVSGGQRTKKARYVARGAAFRVGGTVKPLVAGQVVLVEVLRKRKVVSRQAAKISAKGRVSVRIKTRRSGSIKVRLRHRATPQQVAFVSRSKKITVVNWSAGQGSRGTKVMLLQRGLYTLGYAVPRTGFYDGGTSRAVLAFRKTNGMGRDGFATRGVYSKVLRRKGAFKARYPKAGRHVEFDWSRQVLVLFNKKGRASRTYHASSGKPSTPTVFGRFRFYRRDLGTNAKGMVDASYFIGGYAIHGYASVPNYPASHGCIRVPVPNARQIRDALSLGEQIFVYR
jgi:lipoprotein-anchoring transpeptidase ErfK/SrfK